MLVDFSEQARKIPGGKVLPGGLGRGGALHETPAILLEVMPVPIGQDRLQKRFHLPGRLFDFGLHAGDFFFGLVALDIAFEDYFAGDGFGRFAVCLVAHSPLNNGIEFLNGRFRQAFADGLVDLFPLCVPGGRAEVDAEPKQQGHAEVKRKAFHNDKMDYLPTKRLWRSYPPRAIAFSTDLLEGIGGKKLQKSGMFHRSHANLHLSGLGLAWVGGSGQA